jgi:hypothetical protein
MAYKLTLLNDKMLWSENEKRSIIVRNERDYDRVCEAPIILNGYAQMQRVLHNDHHGEAEYGYELTMMRNPLTTIDVRVRNQSDGCKLIYQDVEFDAGVLDLIITNVKNEEAYHKIPAPKSIEAKVFFR